VLMVQSFQVWPPADGRQLTVGIWAPLAPAGKTL
jgi:hypothetical protein